MSREVWLRPNRRIFAVAIVKLAVLLAIAIMLVLTAWHVALVVVGWVGIAFAVLAIASMVQFARQPRLAYDDGHLLVFLGSTQPHRVPIELVECFFLGQGPSLLRVSMFSRSSESPESSTIVVRLAESAEDWKHFEVRPDHGLWCDGYITIRGTLCEPINADRLTQLNHRLVEVHREQRKNRERETA